MKISSAISSQPKEAVSRDANDYYIVDQFI